jgi:hypothetical protein
MLRLRSHIHVSARSTSGPANDNRQTVRAAPLVLAKTPPTCLDFAPGFAAGRVMWGAARNLIIASAASNEGSPCNCRLLTAFDSSPLPPAFGLLCDYSPPESAPHGAQKDALAKATPCGINFWAIDTCEIPGTDWTASSAAMPLWSTLSPLAVGWPRDSQRMPSS